MSNHDLAIQYKLMIALLEAGRPEEVIKILKDEVRRLEGEKYDTKQSSDSSSASDQAEEVKKIMEDIGRTVAVEAVEGAKKLKEYFEKMTDVKTE